MVNIFQTNYESRLQSWFDLRNKLQDADIVTKCVEVDTWWQRAPLVNRYLHILDSDAWPGPWELLADNTYCEVARALGMCYTLLLLGIDDVSIVEATDNTGDDVVIVLVDNAKYVLNYWPNMVVNINSNDFTIRRTIDISKIKTKLQ